MEHLRSKIRKYYQPGPTAVAALFVLPTLCWSQVVAASDQFELLSGAPGNVTATLVLSETAGVFDEATPLFTRMGAVAYTESHHGEANCRIAFLLDPDMGQLTIFHMEGKAGEAHSLYRGGVPGGGTKQFRNPSDLCSMWTFYYHDDKDFDKSGLVEYYRHDIYVADKFNKRIQYVKYFTHQYDAEGNRLRDQVIYGDPIGSGRLDTPTGVTITDCAERTLVVADRGAKKIIRFEMPGGAFLEEIDSSDLNQGNDFYPYKIAACSMGGREFYACLSKRADEAATDQTKVIVFEKLGAMYQVNGILLDETIIDVDASEEMGMIALTSSGKLYHLDIAGSAFKDYSLSSTGIAFDCPESIGIFRDRIAVAFDYDEDSGLSIMKMAGDAVLPRVGKNRYFWLYEPVDVFLEVYQPGYYQIRVVDAAGSEIDALATNEFFPPGEHYIAYQPDWDYVGCRIEVEKEGQCWQSEPFDMMRNPYVNVMQPEPWETFDAGTTMYMVYEVDFVEAIPVDSIVTYLSCPILGQSWYRWYRHKLPNRRGVVQDAMSLPMFLGNCIWTHYQQTRIYASGPSQEILQGSHTFPFRIQCGEDDDPLGGKPCVYPCWRIGTMGAWCLQMEKIFSQETDWGMVRRLYLPIIRHRRN